MAGSLGDAYIEVHSDTSKVGPEMKAGVKEAAEEVEADDFDGIVKAVDKAGTRAGSQGGKNAADAFVRDANGRLRTLDGKFATEGDRIGDAISDGIEKKTKSRIGRLGGLLAPDWIKSIGVWIVALGPAAVELAATLAPAAGLIALIVPAAIGAAASLGILKIAFSGVGKAIQDINGPAKTFNADLDKLTASQRAFVMEVKGVQPQLKAFKNTISQNFFADFSGSVTELGTKLLPGVSKALGYVAEQLGGVGKKLADVLSKKSSIAELNTIFFGFGSAVGVIGDALPSIADALLRIGSNAAPFLDEVAIHIENMAQSFDQFIKTAVNDGAFNKFIQNAFVAFGKLDSVLKSVYTIVTSIFSGALASGGGDAIIGKLATVANVFKELSASGGLKAAFDIYNSFFSTVGKLLGPLIPPLSTFLKLLGSDLAKDIKDLLPGLLSLVNDGLVPLFPALDNILSVINPVVDATAKFLSAILTDPTATKIVVDTLIAYLVAVKGAGLAAAIQGIAFATDTWVASLVAADVALDAVGIGEVILALGALALAVYEVYKYSAKLVDKLGGWGKIWKDITSGVKSAYTATSNFVTGIGGDIADFFTKTIPAAFKKAQKFITGIGGDIADFFTKTIPDAFNNHVVPFFEGLPGIIGGFLKKMLGDALFLLGEFIGLVFVAFFKLPGIIGDAFVSAVQGAWRALQKLPGFVAMVVTDIDQFFADTIHSIGQDFVKLQNDALTVLDKIVGFFQAAPGRIKNALEGLGHDLAVAFAEAWKDGKKAFDAGIAEIVSGVKALPGKLEAFGGVLKAAGKALVKGFLDGLEDVGGLIKNVAGDIVGAIKDGLNKAIDKINSGINSVASTFFISVPNIPRLATGAYITKPTMALIGERNPEVVLPTDNPSRALQLLNQSGLAASLNMGTPNVNVGVFIGQQPINDIVDTRIEYSNDQTAKQLNFGTRG